MIEKIDFATSTPWELGRGSTVMLNKRQDLLAAKINEIIDVINTHIHPDPFNEWLDTHEGTM